MKLGVSGSFFLVFSLGLSACAPLTQVGPTAEAQENAVLQCARDFGGDVFPITTSVRIEFGAGQQSALVEIQPNERLTQSQANSINSCARDALSAEWEGVDAAAPEVGPTLQEVQELRRRPDVPTSPCPRGSSVMRAGTQYCVGLK